MIGKTINNPAFMMLATIFILSRLICYSLGIRFYTNPLLWFYQYIDPYLMQNNLIQSSLYLHTQPPLFNLLVGGIMKFYPSYISLLLQSIFFLIGFILCICVWQAGLNLKFSKTNALLLTIFFILSPAAILYENWMFYTYPIAVLLMLAFVSLQRFVVTRSITSATIFFSCLAGCVLIRTAFHLIWLLGIFFVLLRFYQSNTKVILKSAAIPLLLVCGFYVWSFSLFRTLPSSTWMGMSFYKVASYAINSDERSAMVKQGKLTKASLVPPYSWLSSYDPELRKTSLTEISVLDQKIRSTGFNNYHNIAYHRIAKMYLKDALYLIYSRPSSYIKGISSALFIYHQSSSTVEFLEPNKSKLHAWNSFYDRILFGQFGRAESFYFLMIAFLILPFYGCWRSMQLIRQGDYRIGLPVLFLAMNVIYVALITCAFEVGENQRYRFEIDAYHILLLGLFISDAKQKILGITNRRRPNLQMNS